MAKRLAACLLVCVGISTCAEAQNANNIMGLFGTMMRAAIIDRANSEWKKLSQSELDCMEQRLQQQGASIRQQIDLGITPADPRLSGLRLACRTVGGAAPPTEPPSAGAVSPTLSASPTFNCATARSPSGRILCLDADGAKADWNLTSAYWARTFALPENNRDAFGKEHESWFPSLMHSCRLQTSQTSFSSDQRQCVLASFRKRAEAYRSQLKGDALAESRLTPEQHADIQRALITREFLHDAADGEFGSATRAAIKRLQAQAGAAESGFLTGPQRAALLEATPPPATVPPDGSATAVAAVDTVKLREARLVLADAQKFIASQTSVPSISTIANEAANLQIALSKFDELAAIQSMRKLIDLLKPIPGFQEFTKERQAERQREDARHLAEAIDEGAKNTFFIDGYIKANLGSPKTTGLVQLRSQISDAIRGQSLENLAKANGALQTYVTDNGLTSTYQEIARNYLNPPARPDIKKTLDERLGVGSKSAFVIRGSPDDIVLLYNASPTAPAVWKNVRGDVLFQEDRAALCFAQSQPDAVLVRYIERLLTELGAKALSSGQNPCDLSKVSASTDVIAFSRGDLLKMPESYIGALVRLIEDEQFHEYQTLTNYVLERKELEAKSFVIESEVAAGTREGYGVLSAGDEMGAACIITPRPREKLTGLQQLLNRNKGVIAPKLSAQWKFVETTADFAYRGLQRQQCAYVFGEAPDLRDIMMASRRDQKAYRFSPVWFSADDVLQATNEARDAAKQMILKDKAVELNRDEERQLSLSRGVEQQKRRMEHEAELRKTHGPRARALKDDIHRTVKDLAEKRHSNGDGLFATYANWLRGRFADQWETVEVTSDIDDFGSVSWKGRVLDAIVVRSMVQQKNRVKGEYSNDCFLFGLIDDPEFSMQREMFSTPCAGSETLVMRWKVGNRFETSWNAAQIVGAGAPAELTRALQGTRFLAIQSDVQAAAIGSASAPPDPITALDAAIAANPDDAAVLSRRGQMLVLKGSFSRAIVDFDAVLKLKPNDPEAYNNRCWANAILGDLRTALHDCDAALAVRPSYADALDSRGFVNLKMGEPDRAMTDYDAALRLNPRQASSLYGRGVAKVKMGWAQEGQRDISAAKALQANIADEFANLGVH